VSTSESPKTTKRFKKALDKAGKKWYNDKAFGDRREKGIEGRKKTSKKISKTP